MNRQECANGQHQGIPDRYSNSLREYEVGQLYTVAGASRQATGGGEGVQVLRNEPYDDHRGKGIYKVYDIDSKVPPYPSAVSRRRAR